MEKEEPLFMAGGVMKVNPEVPQKIKDRTAMCPNYTTFIYNKRTPHPTSEIFVHPCALLLYSL